MPSLDSRRLFVRQLLPGVMGLVVPAPDAGRGLVRPAGALTPIPYADLPTGSGSWDAGAGATTTITRALTISGLLSASANIQMPNNQDLRTKYADGTVRQAVLLNASDVWSLFERKDGSAYGILVSSTGGVTIPSTLAVTGVLTASGGLTTPASYGLRFTNGSNWNIETDANGLYLTQTGVQRLYKWTTGALSPNAAGGTALGSTALPWSTLFVNDGAAATPSLRFGSEATGLYLVGAGKLAVAVAGYGALMMLKNTDGNPEIGPISSTQQLSLGEKGTGGGGYILLNGLGYGTENGDVLITGNAQSGQPGDVKIRSYNGTSTYDNAIFRAGGEVNIARSGLTVGAPTGGDKGVGKINVAGDIYKNNTAYTNPDYVFETAYEGAPRGPAPSGYRLQALAEVERFTREHLHLPGISREASGMFARADMLLEKVEELYLHAFALGRRLDAVEAENRALRGQLQTLAGVGAR